MILTVAVFVAMLAALACLGVNLRAGRRCGNRSPWLAWLLPAFAVAINALALALRW